LQFHHFFPYLYRHLHNLLNVCFENLLHILFFAYYS
jgi:hypothetical protein